MKNMVMGIIIGVSLTLLGAWGYSSFISEKPDWTVQDKSTKIAEREREAVSNLSDWKPGSFEKEDSGKDELQTEQKIRDDMLRESSENQLQDSLREDVSSNIESFSGMMSEGRSPWLALAQEIRGLKNKGQEGLAELFQIIDGEGSEFFKMIAAGVLGEIYSETRSPEVETVLERKILPLIQSILDGEFNMRLKHQAIATLGELGLQSAQDMLVDSLLDDTGQWLQLTSMRVLQEKGNHETAFQLVEILQSSEVISHIMLAAGALGKMNHHLNDHLISEAIQSTIPKLKWIIDDENQTFQNKRSALMTLGSMGTSASMDSLIRVMAEQAGKNNELGQLAAWVLSRNGTVETAHKVSRQLSASTSEETKILLSLALGGMALVQPDVVALELSQSLALPTLKNISQAGMSIDIQRKAIAALGNLGEYQDIAFLQQIALDNPVLQPTADQAIQQIQNRVSGQGRRPMSRFMRPGF